MVGQPWEVAWLQAQAGRTRMLDEWRTLADRNDESVWWIRKAGNEHYDEHLGRLTEWTQELIARRSSR